MHFVAIKTIRQHESEKEQFLSEMRVMSNMIHPNIVRLFGLVQQGIYITVCMVMISNQQLCINIVDQPWIVLEYLPNGDLNTFLKVFHAYARVNIDAMVLAKSTLILSFRKRFNHSINSSSLC